MRKLGPHQLLDYISQSFEIIISMKQDERLQTQPNPTHASQSEAEDDLESVSSQNLIMQSIKEAVVHMKAKEKRLKENPNLTGVYERMI